MSAAGVVLAHKFAGTALSEAIASSSTADIEAAIRDVMDEHSKDCDCEIQDGAFDRVMESARKLDHIRSDYPIEFLDALHVLIEREEIRQ